MRQPDRQNQNQNQNFNNQQNPDSNAVFRLRDMVKTSFDLWVISWFLGLVFAISIVALLMISGWFITGAALAGLIAVGSHSFNYMLPAGIIRMLAIARTSSRYGELMVSHNAVFNLLKTLRLTFFDQLALQPLSKMRRTLHASQYMHRLVSDIDKLDEFILRVVSPWLIASTTLILLSGFIVWVLPIALWLKVILCGLWISALLLPLLATYFGIKSAQVLADVSEGRRQKLLAPLAIITQLLLWQQWHTQTTAYSEQDNLLQQLEWQAQKKRTAYMLGIQWLVYASILIVLLGVAMLDVATLDMATLESNMATIIETSVNNHIDINIPMVLAVVLGLLGIQEIIVPLGQHYLALGNSIAAKNRLNALLDNQTDTHSDDESIDNSGIDNSSPLSSILPLPSGQLTAKLEHVYTRIPQALVGAQDVNVTVRSGTPLIIRGPSGCGKSTLLQMLAGEIPLLSGYVTLNAQDWFDYDWQDQLGYLGQQLDIFDQSLANNLRLGKLDASDDQLIKVLKKVGLFEWLQSQPQGLATPLGEYGAAISGGQARRIALARLLLKPRKVLLLDEPFAGLDENTRKLVWHSIRQHQKDGLLIIVSHHDWDMGEVNELQLQEGIFSHYSQRT